MTSVFRRGEILNNFDNDSENDDGKAEEDKPDSVKGLGESESGSSKPREKVDIRSGLKLKMPDNGRECPFNLRLWFHSATNLPICDFTASDPYIVVFQNDVLISRTKTIFGNCNPKWEDEEHVVNLLHTNCTIVLKVFHQNQRKTDILMGVVSIDLSKTQFNTLIQHASFPIEQVQGKIVASGTVEMTYLLSRRDDLIRMVPKDDFKIDILENDLASIQATLDDLATPEPVCNEMLHSMVLQNIKLFSCRHDMITDYLYDARSLALDQMMKELQSNVDSPMLSIFEHDTPIQEALAEVPMTVVRKKSKMVSALQLDINALKKGMGRLWIRAPPIELVSIEIRFTSPEKSSTHVRIALQNWYLQCVWSLWLTIGLDLIHRKEESEWFGNLPDFVSEHGDIFTSHSKLAIENGKSLACHFSLSLKQPPYKLLFQCVSTGDPALAIDLGSVTEVVVSTTSAAPSPLLMKVSVNSADVYKKTSLVPLVATVAEVPKATPKPSSESETSEGKESSATSKSSSRGGILGGLSRRVSGLTNTLLGHTPHISSAYQAIDATTKLSKIVDKKRAEEDELRRLTERNDGANAEKAPEKRKTLGTGRIISKITGVISDTADAAVSVVSTVKNEVEHGFKSGESYEHFVVVKASTKTHKTNAAKGHRLDWASEHALIDIPVNSNAADNAVTTLDGVLFFLFDASNTDMVGVKFLPFSQIISPSIWEMISGNCSSGPNLVDFADFHDIFLNDKISLNVTIVSAHYLRIPAHAHPGGVYAVAQFGAWNGAHLGSITKVSSSVAKNRHPVWTGDAASLTLNAEDGLHWAEYISISFFDGNSVGSMPVGIAYIPISDFEDPEKVNTEQRYEVFNRLHGNYVQDEEIRYGWTKIRIRAKIEQDVGRAQVRVGTKFYRSNEFTTTWPTEGMLLGSVAKHKEGAAKERADDSTHNESVAEKFTILPSYKNLVLFDVALTGEGSAEELNIRQARIDLSTASAAQEETSSSKKSAAVESISVRCYENQRRAFTHGLNWQRLKKCGFSEVDVSKSQPFTEKEAAEPPEGYSWAGDWELDFTHHKTGEDGWIYAVDFNAMRFNLRTGLNFTSPILQSVRRRRWNRRAVKVGKSSAKTGAKHVSHAWRSSLLAADPNSCFSTCQERKSEAHPIAIPWSQVKSCHAVTPTDLCIYLTINRFMEFQENSFVEVDAILFVSGCYANELKVLMDERCTLYATRQDVSAVVTSGKLCSEETDIHGWDDGTGHFEAEEMPFGSRVVADIDGDAIFLERHVQELQNLSRAAESEWEMQGYDQQSAKYIRRASRLRLYIATMLNAKLTGKHDYDVESVMRIMEEDFKKAKCIGLEDEVAQANDRIEFLLDTAEMRLREAALCGWDYRGEKLESCIETLVNGYFIEMVGTLGAFFDSGVMSSLQGFGGKLELIITYMKHNDRLSTILDSACKPYRIGPSLSPKPSYFLDIDMLIGWYSQVLQTAMVDVVDKCLEVWRDKSKGASKLTDMYNYKLPWIPDRERGKDGGIFKTAIPEDVIRGLENYIMYARVKKVDIAPSFHKTVEKIDLKVHTSYIMALLHLSEQYMCTLESCNWTTAGDDEQELDLADVNNELTEHFEWICCIIGDSHRIRALRYCNPMKKINVGSDEWDIDNLLSSTVALSEKVYQSFANIIPLGIDWLSCVIFAKVLTDPELARISGRGALQAWRSTAPDVLSTEKEQSDSIIVGIIHGVADLIEENEDALSSEDIYQLTCVCVNKIISLCLMLLKQSKDANLRFDKNGPLVMQMERDFKVLHKRFTDLLQQLLHHNEVTLIALRDMELAHTLIASDKESRKFKDALTYCVKHSKKRPTAGGSLRAFTQCCIDLRADCAPKAAPVLTASAAMRRMSAFVFSSVAAPEPPPPEVVNENEEFLAYCTENMNIMQLEHDQSDIETRNSILAMEPIEKVFCVDQDLAKRSVFSVITSSASIFSQTFAGNKNEPTSSVWPTSVIFTSLRTSILPCVNATRQPHCYAQFLINDNVVAETSVIKDNQRPNWSQERVQVNLAGARRFLRCRIMIKNYIWEDVPLGFVEIPLISLDMMKSEQTFPLDCSISPTAEAAVEKLLEEGGMIPKLYVCAQVVM